MECGTMDVIANNKIAYTSKHKSSQCVRASFRASVLLLLWLLSRSPPADQRLGTNLREEGAPPVLDCESESRCDRRPCLGREGMGRGGAGQDGRHLESGCGIPQALVGLFVPKLSRGRAQVSLVKAWDRGQSHSCGTSHNSLSRSPKHVRNTLGSRENLTTPTQLSSLGVSPASG